MKAKPKYTLPLLALAATTLFSCSEESWFEKGLPDPAKELIDFTGTNGSITRAGLQTRADGQGELKSFGGETKVAMYIKSDGATASDVRHTITEMKATAASSCSETMHLTAASKNGDVQAPHDHLKYSDAAAFRYWDDAFGRKAKLSVYAIAVPGKTTSLLSKLTGTTGETGDRPYISSTNMNWFTGLSEETFVWSVMHENFQNANTIAEQDICYSNNIKKDSSVKGVYRYYNSGSNTMTFYQMEGDRMKWFGLDNKSGDESTSTAGKFDQGHLIFKHALSKITINLFEADNTSENKGFNNNDPKDFKFPTDADGNVTSNVWLIDFPYENKFDLNAGDWKEYNTSSNSALKIGEFKGLYYAPTLNTPTSKQKLTVSGLVLPGKNLADDTKNSLRFIIDGNEYFVTSKQIATAIQTYYAEKLPNGENNPNHNATLASFTTMKQGEHYEINITVSKSKIDAITAQLVDWEKVSANITDPSNAYVKIQVEERTNTNQYKEYVSNGYSFDLYRAPETDALNTTVSGENNYYNGIAKYNWKTGYVAGSESDPIDKATKTFANNTWSTEWCWPNNETYYHFRMVGNTEGTTELSRSNVSIKKDASKGDYYEITSGSITGSFYKDYTWAAPFLKNDGEKWDYDLTDGFDGKEAKSATPKHQIYKAIGATNDKINLMMFHMTSQIFFNVKTTTDNDKVELRNSSNKDTEVELLYFYKDGIVRVGNGLVETKDDSFEESEKIEFVEYHAEVAAADPKPATPAYSEFRYGVVPQALSGTYNEKSYTVGIRITTPDGNQYVVKDISQVLATTADITSINLKNPYTESTSESGKYTIDRWYPGYKYTYTVTLKKTGIESITAQLVDWETVKGDLGTITLEK